MRIKNTKPYYLKRKTIVEDSEGGKYSGYEDNHLLIMANIFPVAGKLQAEIYGERLNYMLSMLYDGPVRLQEGDGICVYVRGTEQPDYRIISIKNHSHKILELEKL